MSRSIHTARARAALALVAVASLLLDDGLAQVVLAASPSAQELDATRRRPLFAPTRRPPPEPVAEPVNPVQPAAVEATPNVEVRGIIFGDNHRIAIVKRPSSPQTVDVAVGSEIDGWVVSDILPRGIVLRRDEP